MKLDVHIATIEQVVQVSQCLSYLAILQNLTIEVTQWLFVRFRIADF